MYCANSGRWIQWRHKAYEAPGDAKSDLWIVDKLYKAVRKAYEADPGPFADPILDLNWDYGDEIDVVQVCKELNGYNTQTGELLENFTQLADDGSTACGNWIYSGYYNNESDPPCKRRIKETEGIGTNPDWAFAWPLNRRIIYNRCSADPAGNPWNPELPVLWYEGGEWKRNDVPDFNANDHRGNGKGPFIMLPELQARFFASGMAEGPFPSTTNHGRARLITHYPVYSLTLLPQCVLRMLAGPGTVPHVATHAAFPNIIKQLS